MEKSMAFDGSRAQYYRKRADEVRALAASCKLPDIKAQLDTVAQEYDALATSIESGGLGS
jgi:hypothetical protein